MPAARAAGLVGRERELQQLRAAVDSARGEVPTFVLVDGDAGIGKTRLLTEAAARCTTTGDIVLRSQAVELSGGDVPYGVVADMLRDLRRQQTGVGSRLTPTVRDTLGALLTTLTGGDAPRLDRGTLLDSFGTLVETLAHGRLVWWLIEDLHWSDASSRDVLAYVIRTIGPCRLLVTMTVRTGEPWPKALATFVAEQARSPHVDRMHLAPLTDAEVAAHVSQLTQHRASRSVLERVRRLGEGNPFWTEELVLGGLGREGPVPDTVRELVEARLLRLGAKTRTLVDVVSVVDLADHELLPDVCGLGEDEIDSACAEAVHEHVLVVSDDGAGYRFRHTLLRETVEQGLLPGRRRRLHRRWAEELDRHAVVTSGPGGHGPAPARDDSRIAAAHHWALAGDPGKALTTAYGAAQLAEKASGTHEQAQLLLRVLENWSAVPDAEARLGVSREHVCVHCIFALFGSGQYERCLELLDQELARPHEDLVAHLYLRLRRHVVLEELARGDEDAGALEELGDHVDSLLGASLDNPWLPGALGMCAYYLSDDEPAVAMQLCERAAEASAATGNLMLEMHAIDGLTWNLANLGRFDEAIDVLTEAVRRSRVREPSWSSMLEGNLSWYLWALGRHQEAVSAARSALRYHRRPQAAAGRVAWLVESLAEALISLGEWDEAARVLDEVVAMPLSGQAAVTLHCLTGLLAVRRGDVTRAREHLAMAQRHTPPQEDALLSQRVPTHWLAAELAATDHDLRGVRSTLSPLWTAPHPEVVSESLWRPMLLLARAEADEATLPVSARSARSARSAQAAQAEQDGAAAAGSWEALADVTEQLHRLGPVGDAWRAHLAAEQARADRRDDVATWQAVVEAWTALGQPYESAWAILREARVHLVTGARDVGASRLEAARRLAQGLGAVPLVEEIDSLARRSRLAGSPALPTQRGGSGGTLAATLTPREREVLALVARGLDNAAVAKELFISSKTASVHVSNILAKLGASSRTQAASMAFRQGLVADEGADPRRTDDPG